MKNLKLKLESKTGQDKLDEYVYYKDGKPYTGVVYDPSAEGIIELIDGRRKTRKSYKGNSHLDYILSYHTRESLIKLEEQADYEEVDYEDPKDYYLGILVTETIEKDETEPKKESPKQPNTPNTCLLYTSPSPRDS